MEYVKNILKIIYLFLLMLLVYIFRNGNQIILVKMMLFYLKELKKQIKLDYVYLHIQNLKNNN